MSAVIFCQVCPNCGEAFTDGDIIIGDLSKGLTKYMWHHKDCEDPTGSQNDSTP